MRLTARKFSDLKILPISSPLAVNGDISVSADVANKSNTQLTEDFGRLFFENSQIIMFSHDLEGKFISCNKATCNTFGFSIEEFSSKKLIDFIAKDASFDIKSYFSELNQHGSSNGQVEVINNKGEKLNCIYKNVLHESSNGNNLVLVSLVDITDRILLEKEILKQKNSAEKNAELKSVFLSNLTHEIRTPMAAITGFGRLLNDTQLSPEQKEYTHALNIASSNMLKMVNDILDSTKIEAGQIVLEEITFDIYEEVQNLRKILNNLAIAKDIQLICEIEKGIDTQIIGDSIRLNQILMNLLCNSIKFTERGFVKIEIKKIKENPSDISLDFIVSDSGIGVAANKLEAIFERFNQATDDTSRKYGGTGLGLSISKSLVELQGGKILLESKLGKGSTFSFVLKFKKSANTDVKPELKSLGTKTKVLLVEDNILNQKLASKILEKLGYQTLLVSNAKDAFTILKSENVDLILMDLQLPDINGKEAAKHIKIKMGLDIPIIAISTNKPTESETGKLFVDFIAKPFEPGEILRKIHSHTRKKVLNLTYLASVSEGNLSFEKEILDSALEIIPAEIINLKAAFKSENFEEISAIAHKLKSTYTILGVDAEKLLNKLEAINKVIDRNASNLLVDIELLHMTIVQNIRIELKSKFKNV
jgi:PAS domain S-box-containing protein